MINLVQFVLVSFGLTQILVYGTIFESVRPKAGWLGKLFCCPMCVGFWVGVFLWGTNEYTGLFNYDFSLFTGMFLGCLSSGTSYILSVLFDDNGLKISGGERDETIDQN